MSKRFEELATEMMAEANKHSLSVGSTGTVHMSVEMRRLQDQFAIGLILDGKFHLIQKLDLIRNIPMGKYRLAYFLVPMEEEKAPDLVSV